MVGRCRGTPFVLPDADVDRPRIRLLPVLITDCPMTIQTPTNRPFQAQQKPGSYRRFVLEFFGLLIVGIAGFWAMLWWLGRADMLPPPPVTGTTCLDEKFKFVATRDVRSVDLIAVGSSVTWRNLDMSAFQRKGIAQRPLNAAPCYLHVGETTYYTNFLLSHMKHVKRVVSVVAPRDFEKCASPKEEFFSSTLAEAYVFGGLPPLLVYLANFRAFHFFNVIFHIKRMRTDPYYQNTMVMDEYGSGPLLAAGPWLPEPLFDNTCFAALAELEKVVNAAGAKLVVATVPLQPEWRAKYDPHEHIVKSFEERIRAALLMPSTQLLLGTKMETESLRHADSIHYVWESAVEYTARLTEQITAKLD
jgi:hypothetical protein